MVCYIDSLFAFVCVCAAWAKLEVSMEDKKEVFMGDVAEITCKYTLDEPDASFTLQWFAVSWKAPSETVALAET